MTALELRNEIATRLAGIRDSVGLTPEKLAQRVGVTPEQVLRYESGEVEIPVSYLSDVARTCAIDLTSLISGGDAYLREFTLTRKGEGLSEDRRKNYQYWNLASRFTGRRMEPFLVSVPPKAEEELRFDNHSGQEFIYILEGELEIWLAGKRSTLEEGDSMYYRSRTPHAMRSLTDKDTLLLAVITG